MNRLSLPTRVTPPPLAVPRWTVQNSRNWLRSPISSQTSSPRELEVLGIEADGGVGVDPVLAADPGRALDLGAGADLGAVADLDAGADHGERPDPDPVAQHGAGIDRARADGSRAAMLAVHHRRGEHRLGGELAVHQDLARQLAVGAAQAQHLDLVADLVAGHHRPAELRLLDRGEEEQLALAVAACRCSSSRPPACAIPSISSTPGITGRPGKWPRKNGSLMVTFLIATIRLSGSISSTRSTSRIG